LKSKKISSSGFYKVVDKEMRKLKSGGWQGTVQWNHYPVSLEVLGITLPVQRARFKQGYAELEGFSREEQAAYWLQVWRKSNLMPSLSQVIFFFETWANERRKLKARGEIEFVFDPMWAPLLEMVDRLDNWIHSDGISGLIAAAVEERSRERYSQLQKWNRDKNPWRRRQSVVSLHYYSRFRQKPLPSPKTLPLIENLLDDDHFYVQRGVGWALRECYNVDPTATMKFLNKHISRIAPIGYYAAVERLSPTEKARLLERRKTARTTKRRSSKAATPRSRGPSTRPKV
jgi:3-methyladenine DNA glycosylase AlkD